MMVAGIRPVIMMMVMVMMMMMVVTVVVMMMMMIMMMIIMMTLMMAMMLISVMETTITIIQAMTPDTMAMHCGSDKRLPNELNLLTELPLLLMAAALWRPVRDV